MNVGGVHSHTVGLRQATHGSIFGQEAILQVDHRLPNLLIFGQHVVVVYHHSKVLLYRQGTGELKHPGEKKDVKTVGALTKGGVPHLSVTIPSI